MVMNSLVPHVVAEQQSESRTEIKEPEPGQSQKEELKDQQREREKDGRSHRQARQRRGKRRPSSQTLKRHMKYLVPQVRLALIRESGAKFEKIEKPEDVERLLEPLKFCDTENFVILHLDAVNNVSGYQICSHGTATASLVHMREVFKAAILSNAVSILVAHNHPGGSLTPSSDDIKTTERLVAAGQLLDIPVIDHVIVSVNGCSSLRENYAYLF
jgi:DNA repair protein RadC